MLMRSLLVFWLNSCIFRSSLDLLSLFMSLLLLLLSNFVLIMSNKLALMILLGLLMPLMPFLWLLMFLFDVLSSLSRMIILSLSALLDDLVMSTLNTDLRMSLDLLLYC